MTHIGNIPHLLKFGLTGSKSPNSHPSYQTIGDKSLIVNRANFVLPNKNKLGDYIPFYFGFRMPMLYVIHNGYNTVNKTPNEDIVYCITSVFEILKNKLEFVYSDGHAIDSFTTFFGVDSIENILENIDKAAIDAKYWRDEHDLDLKRRKEAEFLVKNDIPVTAILGFVVYNVAAQQKLINFGIDDKHIVIKPSYYF